MLRLPPQLLISDFSFFARIFILAVNMQIFTVHVKILEQICLQKKNIYNILFQNLYDRKYFVYNTT